MNCPRCNEVYVDKMFNVNKPLNDTSINAINEFIGTNEPSFCTKCWSSIKIEITSKARGEVLEINNFIKENVSQIPIISLQSPLNWDYKVVGLVTGQSVTGTGVLSEITSTITDLSGSQSETFNTKLKVGEDLCFYQMRTKALEMGANAIIAVDIDYAEVGSNKGMLMVCSTGTAIKLNNCNILSNGLDISIEKLSNIIKKKSIINEILNI